MTATTKKDARCRRTTILWPVAALLVLAACSGGRVENYAPATQAPVPPAASTVEPQPPVTAEPLPTEPQQPLAADGMVRVAVLLPLSGPDAAIGKAMLDAAQMAVFDIADERLRLMAYDTMGDAIVARSVAEKALQDGARLILGPLFSTSVAEIAPVAREAGVNVIAFSNNRSVAGDNAFLIGLLPSEQIRRVASYAAAQGLRRYAVLIPESPFGQQVAADLQEAVTRFGGVVTRVQSYPPELRDLSPAIQELADYRARGAALKQRKRQLERIRSPSALRELKTLEKQQTLGDVDYDALLLPQHGAQLRSIAALLPFYDIDTAKVRVLGMASWEGPDLGKEPPLVGAWYPAPQLEARTEFDRRFSDTYGYGAPVLASLAYDAAALAAVLARAPGGPDFSAASITTASGFAGTGGIFRFLPNGQSQRSFAIMEVRPDRARVIDPAPRSFADLTN